MPEIKAHNLKAVNDFTEILCANQYLKITGHPVFIQGSQPLIQLPAVCIPFLLQFAQAGFGQSDLPLDLRQLICGHAQILLNALKIHLYPGKIFFYFGQSAFRPSFLVLLRF